MTVADGLGAVGAVVGALGSLRPVATIRADACTRRHGSSCSGCVMSCPQDAVLLDGDHRAPRVDPDACVGCGLCVTACPVDAVGGVGVQPARVAAAARATADAAGDLELRCHAARRVDRLLDDDAYTVDVVCLGAVRPETVAAAAAQLRLGRRPGSGLRLVHADCETCPVGAADAVAESLSAACALAARVAPGVPVRAVRLDGGAEPAAGSGGRTGVPRGRRWGGRRRAEGRDPVHVSRRDLFRGMTGRTTAVDQPGDPQAPALAPAGSAHDVLTAAAPSAPVTRPVAADGCTGCRACVQVCPADALGWVEWSGGGVLSVDPTSCTGCGECARVCPEDVLGLACELAPGPAPARVLARVPRAGCTRCGGVLAPGEQDTCTPCRSRRAILDDVWSQYG